MTPASSPRRHPRGRRRTRAWLAVVVGAALGAGCGDRGEATRAVAGEDARAHVDEVASDETPLAGAGDVGLASAVVPRDPVGAASRRGADGPEPDADLVETLAFDPDVRRVAEALMGRVPDDALPDERARERQRRYRASVEASWASFDREIGAPMSAWAKAQIEPLVDGESRVVFYPFGGADFVTAHRLAPNARRYVMVAMQRAGPVPDLDAMKQRDRRAVHRALRHRVEAFSRTGFFVTTQMNATYHEAMPVKGITGQLMLFAELEGYDVLDVSPIRVDPETAELVVRTESLDRSSTWSSVRLDLRRRSDGTRVTLDYLRMDLSNRGLRPKDVDGDGDVEPVHPHERWLRSVAGDLVVLKAASHLPQQQAFSRVRDVIVEEAKVVVQDETAIDFDTLSAHFAVRLFGDYQEANELFDGRSQASLAAAYAAAEHVPALPFAYGYRKRAGASLQLAHAKRDVSAPSPSPIAGAVRSD